MSTGPQIPPPPHRPQGGYPPHSQHHTGPHQVGRHAQGFTAPKPMRNGMGTAGFVLGAVAVILALIPFIGLFGAIPLGLLALIFGTVGIIRVFSKSADNPVLTSLGLLGGLTSIIVAVASTVAFTGLLVADDDSTNTASGSHQSGSSRGGSATSAGDEEQAVPDEVASREAEAAKASAEAEEAAKNRFPGQLARDVIGDVGDSLEVRGVTVTVSDPQRVSEAYLGEFVCADVEVLNDSDSRVSYHEWDWSFQHPSGDIQMPAWSGRDGDLSAGDLAPGGSVKGEICFDDKAESGQHVFLFEGFITLDSSRGVWLAEL